MSRTKPYPNGNGDLVSQIFQCLNLFRKFLASLLAGERKDESETISREEAQKLVDASVELSDEEIRHKKERSRLIIIILIVFLLLLISLTLNVISLTRS